MSDIVKKGSLCVFVNRNYELLRDDRDRLCGRIVQGDAFMVLDKPRLVNGLLMLQVLCNGVVGRMLAFSHWIKIVS